MFTVCFSRDVCDFDSYGTICSRVTHYRTNRGVIVALKSHSFLYQT